MRTTRAPGEQRRAQIVGFISEYWRTHGYSPSYDDVAMGVGISKNTVRHHLVRLQDDGVLRFDAGRVRSLRLTDHQ